jgi:host factor-I protein
VSEFDTSLPGVRLLQQWIRQRRPLRLHLASGKELEGRLIWQDQEFLALLPPRAERPQLVARRRIEWVEPLDTFSSAAEPAPATIPSPRLPLPPS